MHDDPGSTSAGENAYVHEMARLVASPALAAGAVDSRVIVGLGDDAAVVRNDGATTVVSVDASIEGVHFRRDWFSWDEIGHRSMASALSDLAAMGAEPAWALSTVGFPEGFDAADARSLAAGIVRAAHEHGAHIVGGDTTRAPVVTLTATVAGNPIGVPITRAGARVGHRLVVSRPLGASAAALAWLSTPARDRPSRVEREAASVVDAYARFRLEFAWARRAVARGVAAMIDVSDGLLIDAAHLAESSGVLVVVDAARVPVDPAAARVLGALGLDVGREVLRSGEEYALLAADAATCAATDADAAEAAEAADAAVAAHAVSDSLGGVVVGEFVEESWHGFAASGGRVLVRSEDGAIGRPGDLGWTHFGSGR